MNHLINIDNGGTLTDICVWDGHGFSFTKTLTTPFDLSQCLFDGIEKASATLYGEKDLVRLLHQTQHIRYSTTQGTNALVERKGPPIGLIVEDHAIVDELRDSAEAAALFDDLVGTRVATVDLTLPDKDLAFDLVQKVNQLTTDGAARIVVVGDSPESEQTLRHVLLRKFPRHLLGSVPLLYSWELVGDRRRDRRSWSSILNSFLHPVMERFLYQAQHRLREHKVTNPLLVYRNDGASSRVAKAIALKTYSSGPRGGMEGTQALANSYGLTHVLMMDVGGTTTDVGSVTGGEIATAERGAVGNIPISFPMSDVASAGVGGSSIIGVTDGRITVGPRSVGAAPGPACFGLGGQEATITDVNLLLGVLDPGTYLDGQLHLDADRARAVITETVAHPLGISLDEALLRMETAYFETMAAVIADLAHAETTLAAFGGAGPMSACGAARLAGVKRVLIPRLAAVFSAFGISFSDIGKSYAVGVPDATAESAAAIYDDMIVRAERDMFQEGYQLSDCNTEWVLAEETPEGDTVATRPYRRGDPVDAGSTRLSLRLDVVAALPHPVLTDDSLVESVDAVPDGVRAVRSDAHGVDQISVYRLDEQEPGARAAGPAIVEGPFFTARVPAGWQLDVTSNGDLILTDTH
ncbi:hydantoinase/oxoprolinase family protein [Mycolicibacterium sp. YH-1]|uniref:hydantoinase/oxoprolinase family protein n=1 Tax=Mycolicibacterium sp. YH-1 TaxID=2908837 RepID=UPI001F4C0444|nr:hydantoinase/oxoprolinase family protein [Mycolicibacterium sp. YH-1]UNB51151.1 hydantoinase/oxoprolinase family protein [Mycolicibacterium sp. YH-1]